MLVRDCNGNVADLRRYALSCQDTLGRQQWLTEGNYWSYDRDHATQLTALELRLALGCNLGPVTLHRAAANCYEQLEPGTIVVYEVAKTMHTAPELWEGEGVTRHGTLVELTWRYRHGNLTVSSDNAPPLFQPVWITPAPVRDWGDVVRHCATRCSWLDLPEAL